MMVASTKATKHDFEQGAVMFHISVLETLEKDDWHYVSVVMVTVKVSVSILWEHLSNYRH